MGSDLWRVLEETYYNDKAVSLKEVEGILVMSQSLQPTLLYLNPNQV